MSFDCKYKAKNYQCLKLKVECSPGIKGCVLHGKYVFPFKEDKDIKGKDHISNLRQ